MAFVVYGQPAAAGAVLGLAVFLPQDSAQLPRRRLAEAEVASELQRLDRARDRAVGQLRQLRADLPADAPTELADVLQVHCLLLEDQDNHAAIGNRIQEQRCNAEWAVRVHSDWLLRQFDGVEDDYLRSRRTDVQQVAMRLLRALAADDDSSVAVPPAADGAPVAQQRILVARDLSPAELMPFRRGGMAALVTDTGSPASHTAIVARGMGLPAVVGVRAASRLLRPGDRLAVDGEVGLVVVNPPHAVRERCRYRPPARPARWPRATEPPDQPVHTSDGQAVQLLANIERPDDVTAARAHGAMGIGLFRSEFLFLQRPDRLPGEEEQYRAYRQVLEAMPGRPVTIRTMDLGADKGLPGTLGREQNPALGLRAIRWSLSQPAIFLVQLRALLRAAAHGRLQVLVPMVSHVHQIAAVKGLLQQARDQLRARGQAFGPLRLGAMIEVPAAALTLPRFLPALDFLSIGTNDLIQYTLATDRGNPAVAPLFDARHPAVLRLVADTIAAGQAAGKPVALCGEMAGDPELAPLLLGLGLREFSMSPGCLPAVRHAIEVTDAARQRQRARELLAGTGSV